MKALMNHMKVLMEEIRILEKRIEPHDTGHIHTTITTLKSRVEELQVNMLNLSEKGWGTTTNSME
jgi:cytochrome c556